MFKFHIYRESFKSSSKIPEKSNKNPEEIPKNPWEMFKFRIHRESFKNPSKIPQKSLKKSLKIPEKCSNFPFTENPSRVRQNSLKNPPESLRNLKIITSPTASFSIFFFLIFHQRCRFVPRVLFVHALSRSYLPIAPCFRCHLFDPC